MTRTNPFHELASVKPDFDGFMCIACRSYHTVADRLGSVASSVKDFFEDLGIFNDGPYFEE